MSGFAEYDQYDGLGLAELVAKGDVTPTELLDEALKRSEAVQPDLNFLSISCAEEARAQIDAGLAEGPFKGVPFLLKDLHLLLTGTRTTYGSAAFQDHTADHNSTLTERYLKAGLVIFGKSNSPEFGLTASTEPRLFGPTRNPWNTEYSAGGSSGGASSAVASGVLPIANASDGGGSIRIPAAACGLFGFKPTRARTPAGPDRGEGWGSLSISHAVSRSVRDNAALLDATSGYALGDPYGVGTGRGDAPGAFLAATRTKPERLRIAFSTKTLAGEPIDPACAAGVERAAKMLSDLGHEVEEAAPDIPVADLRLAQAVLVCANTALTVTLREEALGRPLGPDDLETVTTAMVEAGKNFSAVDYARSTVTIHRLGRIMGAFHQRYDVFLQSTLGTRVPKIGVLDLMRSDLDAYFEDVGRTAGLTPLANMTGQPSMSLPLHWDEAGLPVGIMATAGFGEDALLFSLAAQLEEAHPWADKRPPVWSGA